MITLEQLQNYSTYLKVIDTKLKKFFEEQSPYIFCKKGCSHCCEHGEYPMSELEFAYLIFGIRTLEPEIIQRIEQNILKVKEEKKKHSAEKKFMHICPFLLKKQCSLYNFRSIVCRSHGLAYFSKDNKIIVPACVDKGLNYSNVYNYQNNKISIEKYKQIKIQQEPLAHNVRLEFLISNEATKELGLDFGEIKPMLEWLK